MRVGRVDLIYKGIHSVEGQRGERHPERHSGCDRQREQTDKQRRDGEEEK